MFTDSPEVNTVPAMPTWLGRRISLTDSPMATRENSSWVLSSCRKRVERSAFSMAVASFITLDSRAPSSSSDVTSVTMFRNFCSWARLACMVSTSWVLCRAMAAWVVRVSRVRRSASPKLPLCLFRHWMTPITSPLAVRTGAAAMLRVSKPVSSSTRALKRGSS